MKMDSQQANKYGGDHSQDALPKKTAGASGNNPDRPSGDSEQHRGADDSVLSQNHDSGFAGYDAPYENTPGKDQDKPYGVFFNRIVSQHGSKHDGHTKVDGAA